MSKRSTNSGSKSIAKSVSASIKNSAFLGSSPVIPGEDDHAYDQLVAIVADAVKPVDIIDVILIRDFVDEEWEVLRYRRASANLIKTAKVKVVADELYRLSSERPIREKLAIKFFERDQDAITKIRTVVDSSELTDDAIIAKAVSSELNDIERLDRLVMMKEARRDNALREITRHHEALAAQLHRVAEKVEDAEFRVVEDKAADAKLADEQRAS